MDGLQQDLINAHKKKMQEDFLKIIFEREKFLKKMIEKHCTFWEKIYIHLAKRFDWKIKFIENYYRNITKPNIIFTAHSDTEIQYGVKIHNIIYWLDETTTI